MSRLLGDIYVASLNYKQLSEMRMLTLEKASIPFGEDSLNRLRSALGFKFDQIAVIQKCNAVMLFLANHSYHLAHSHVVSRMLSVWDQFSGGAISENSNDIKKFTNEEAIQYLGEVAMGLHSVVIGDSQVFNQVKKALMLAYQLQPDSPVCASLVDWLEKIHSDVAQSTKLFEGHTSLERLACDKIQSLPQDAKVALIGLGQAGQLVCKILTTEQNRRIMVTNRTEDPVIKVISKYQQSGISRFDFGSVEALQEVDAIVFAVDSTHETRSFANDVSQALVEKKLKSTLVIDLCSPGLISHTPVDASQYQVVSMVDLSKDASRIRDDRQSCASQARNIIRSGVPDAIQGLHKVISDSRDRLQRKEASQIRLSPSDIAILKIRDTGLRSVRDHLQEGGFIEIQTPHIVGITTDPPRVDKGTAFSVSWPSQSAYLRQSPQMYKQLIIVAGAEKVFEIGPFWRAETYRSIRHLEETIGLDVEVREPESLETIYGIAYDIIVQVAKSLKTFRKGRTSLYFPEHIQDCVMTYAEAIELLNQTGYQISYGEDLGIRGEYHLGHIVKDRHKRDIVIIVKYPDTIKKFYTRWNDDGTTETFDVIFCGWELASGALRETRIDNIERRMKIEGINPGQYDFYLAMLKDAPPHGGFGMGFDRLIAKSMGFDNISQAVLFPRTFERLIP